MFRRRTSGEPADSPGDARAGTSGAPSAGPGRTAGKGRPTPKRSDAEKRRRQPLSRPAADRRGGGRQPRTRDRAERTRRMEAMRRGEEWALAPKDRGPARALVRNYVDSRRTFSEYYLIGAFAVVFVLFVPALRQRLIVDYVVIAILAVLVIETSYHGGRVLRLVRQRYPGETTKGLRMYMAKRMIAMRAARIPGPAVKPGDKI